jgi:hypothetical protein
MEGRKEEGKKGRTWSLVFTPCKLSRSTWGERSDIRKEYNEYTEYIE